MKLHQLRAFVTVIEQSSISGAARQLSMTPSSVSAHIKALETDFASSCSCARIEASN